MIKDWGFDLEKESAQDLPKDICVTYHSKRKQKYNELLSYTFAPQSPESWKRKPTTCSCDGSAVSLGKDELIPVKFINIKYNTYFKLPLRRESTLIIF